MSPTQPCVHVAVSAEKKEIPPTAAVYVHAPTPVHVDSWPLTLTELHVAASVATHSSATSRSWSPRRIITPASHDSSMTGLASPSYAVYAQAGLDGSPDASMHACSLAVASPSTRA